MYNKNSVEINIASIAICHVEKNHENVFDLELVKGNKVYSLVFFCFVGMCGNCVGGNITIHKLANGGQARRLVLLRVKTRYERRALVGYFE